jgi:hypothetical protein
MQESINLSEFIENFFKNLGATVILQGDFLIVSNVPLSFEKFYGKKSPYKFVFKPSEDPDAELVEKGSYTMKSISTYLENSGQITLLKINFELDPEQEIKKRINFGNTKIIKLSRKKKFTFLFRFTFHTTFQYLNEKEKIINDLYIYDGKTIEGNLENYKVSEGNKREVNIPDMKESYFVAKDNLKKKVSPKIEEISLELNQKLELEKRRIEEHFFQENKELTESLHNANEKLDEYERDGDPEKISRQIKFIATLRKKTNYEEINKDKERALQLEKQKHMLNVNNKLFNTTLIYYPLELFDAVLQNGKTKRIIEISYDPLNETLKEIPCESCDTEIKDIYLCSTGHISCKDCYNVCESCGKPFCKKCIRVKCELCEKHVCKNCIIRCFRCGKLMCKDHTKEEKISGRVYCSVCLRRCERCGNSKPPYNFRRSKKTEVEICEDCYREEVEKDVMRNVFE